MFANLIRVGFRPFKLAILPDTPFAKSDEAPKEEILNRQTKM